ncbi:MAG: sugar phosphate isomerase/epimerase [Verrucomicrobia bacterium]|nr:sugar phosphate isomerase/epimerase [Verrucomicrobiota bacterium]
MMISRRHFLATVAATAAAGKLWGAGRTKDNIRLGMMLQGASAAELHEKAKAVAGAGFDTIQLNFFFQPTADELVSLARALNELKLKTTAFGTYFNLFQPDNTGFMRSSIAAMKLVAAHAGLFDCRQFVTWSGSYATKFRGEDLRNHTPEAVAQLHRAIREVVLPVIEPINGRVAFEPFYLHVVGTPELARKVVEPFPVSRVGLVLDPPNFVSPAQYPKREDLMRRLFPEIGDRVQVVHFKDFKLGDKGDRVDLPGPGDGEMDYPWFISEIRKLKHPLPCIIEHIKPDPAEMSKKKAWVEARLGAPKN